MKPRNEDAKKRGVQEAKEGGVEETNERENGQKTGSTNKRRKTVLQSIK